MEPCVCTVPVDAAMPHKRNSAFSCLHCGAALCSAPHDDDEPCNVATGSPEIHDHDDELCDWRPFTCEKNKAHFPLCFDCVYHGDLCDPCTDCCVLCAIPCAVETCTTRTCERCAHSICDNCEDTVCSGCVIVGVDRACIECQTLACSDCVDVLFAGNISQCVKCVVPAKRVRRSSRRVEHGRCTTLQAVNPADGPA
jgi:hypothetical protein